MDDLEFFHYTHAALRDAANAARNDETRKHLATLREEAWERLNVAKRCTPLVFAMHPCADPTAQRGDAGEGSLMTSASTTAFAPASLRAGYVWIGNKGFEQACAHPGYPGIDEAWAILLHGATVGSVLHAQDFGSSGNALHGRLKTAIEWVKDATGCFDLADYIGAIKVGRDGSITPPFIARRIEFQL